MLNKLFGKPRDGGESTNAAMRGSSNGSTLQTLSKLQETIEMLEKRQLLLEKKVADEHNKAKEFTRMKNKKAALMCLKRKKLYEQQVETLANNTLRIQDQIITLEGAKATTETVKAMREGAGAMKNMQKQMSITSVDDVMDEIQEQTENMRQIQEALSAPIGALAELDEDDLDAELAELDEEFEEAERTSNVPAEQTPAAAVDPFAIPSLPAVPTTAVPATQAALPSVPTTAVQAKTDEEKELEALQAEMAL